MYDALRRKKLFFRKQTINTPHDFIKSARDSINVPKSTINQPKTLFWWKANGKQIRPRVKLRENLAKTIYRG